jgi:hypothetical protein
VKAWAKNQKVGRPDAIRQLVERGVQAFVQDSDKRIRRLVELGLKVKDETSEFS